VTVTLNSAETPTVTVNGEQSTYTLDATITNVTSGESIEAAFEMDLNQTLEIDTAEKTVKYLKDNSSQFQAISWPGGARREWLALAPGGGTITFSDTGTTGGTLVVTVRKRYY